VEEKKRTDLGDKVEEELKIRGSVSQEEVREFVYGNYQGELVFSFFDNIKIEGYSTVIGEDMYYISQEKYGMGIVAGFDEDDDLIFMIGDSFVLGKMKRDIEREIGSSLRNKAYRKAKYGSDNMGFEIVL